jgi:hypothetical protein
MIRFCKQRGDPARLKGFLTAPWFMTLKAKRELKEASASRRRQAQAVSGVIFVRWKWPKTLRRLCLCVVLGRLRRIMPIRRCRCYPGAIRRGCADSGGRPEASGGEILELALDHGRPRGSTAGADDFRDGMSVSAACSAWRCGIGEVLGTVLFVYCLNGGDALSLWTIIRASSGTRIVDVRCGSCGAHEPMRSEEHVQARQESLQRKSRSTDLERDSRLQQLESIFRRRRPWSANRLRRIASARSGCTRRRAGRGGTFKQPPQRSRVASVRHSPPNSAA